VPYSKQERLPPWTMKDIRWMMGGYITTVHLLALFGLTFISSCKPATLFWAFILWPISGFGITGGAHRLWSHRSYTAALSYRWVVMIFNSIANQGTIWHWARDHRVHHFHSETVADPHDAIRGFTFAHSTPRRLAPCRPDPPVLLGSPVSLGSRAPGIANPPCARAISRVSASLSDQSAGCT
jgi:stearoyl-CoA desaturase (Delta-9 desaturase)